MKIQFKNRVYAYLDFLESLSGFCLALFLATHLIFDATILLGPWAYNNIPVILHKYYLAQLFVPVVIVGFFAHFVLAWRKIPFTYNNVMKFGMVSIKGKHRDSLLWIVQMVTGMLLLLLGSLHFWEITTAGLTNINAITSAERAALIYFHVFYYIFMATAISHAGIGVYRLWIKWFGVMRKGILILCILVSCGYIVLSIFSIQRFNDRGQIQTILKLQIIQLQEDYADKKSSDIVLNQKKHFRKTMKKLKLQYNRDLFEFLNINVTDDFYEFLRKEE